MTGDTGLKKGWKRLLVILCTLLLAGSVLLVFGVMGWAQDEAPQEDTSTEAETQEEGTETPAEEGQETGEQAEVTSEEQPTGEITVEYWEPQLGDRTVYFIEDGMDIHGQVYGTSMLGYWDDFLVWESTWDPVISIRQDFLDYSDYYYKSVDAVSNMNPCYFQLEGPWYFNMTTPWKLAEEVIGIHEAPDAHLYPEATYAVNFLFIWSGGFRITGTAYRSNDPNTKEWRDWGFTREYVKPGETWPTKEVIHYRNPHDRQLSAPLIIASFPMSIGTTGVRDAVYIEGGIFNRLSDSLTYEVVSEGEITVPAGTFDAVLVKYSVNVPPGGGDYNNEGYNEISYGWTAQNVGDVADVTSLPDIVDDPIYEEATSIYVLEEFTSSGGGEQQ